MCVSNTQDFLQVNAASVLVADFFIVKILHVVPTYWPAVRYGGPIYSVHGLCAALAQKGHSVTVFTTSVDGNKNSEVIHDQEYEKDGVKIYYYSSIYLRRIFFSKSLRQSLEQRIKEFDLVHLHSIFLYPTNAAARIAQRNNIPYIVSPRGMLEKALIKNKSRLIKTIWLKLVERKTLEQADLIHVTSNREKQELERFNYSFPETVVIPNGVESSLINDGSGAVRSNTFQVLFIGRINWKKQIDKLIESLGYLKFTAKLIIAGNDEENYRSHLEQLITDLNIHNNNQVSVEFVGSKHSQEKAQLFLQSDVMVLPSLSENFGNTVIESMAAGCPVVVTPEVGASEMVQKAGAGLMTTGQPKDIAKQITYIKENPGQAKQMSKNGIDEVRMNYLWTVIANSMTSAYQDLIFKNG